MLFLLNWLDLIFSLTFRVAHGKPVASSHVDFGTTLENNKKVSVEDPQNFLTPEVVMVDAESGIQCLSYVKTGEPHCLGALCLQGSPFRRGFVIFPSDSSCESGDVVVKQISTVQTNKSFPEALIILF